VQLVVAAVVGVAAVVVAWVIRKRTRPDPPTQVPYAVPPQLDRRDFVRPDAPWLVVTFSSTTCSSCEDAWQKAQLLESPAVAVQDVEVSARKDLHDRYAIEAVPMILVADDDGDVRASFIGAPTAADLWAALAELRDPGSTPSACDHHQSAPSS
jgi:hypothetical protein